jgi:hypothetical protein
MPLRGSIDKNGRPRIGDTLDWGELRRQLVRPHHAATSKTAYAPKKAFGEPAIGFAAKPVVSPPWNARVGDFALEIVIRSAGGAGRGLDVIASGPGLGSLELSSVEMAGVSAPFRDHPSGKRAVLETVELPQGFAVPYDPKPKGEHEVKIAQDLVADTHLRMKLRGTAKRESEELLTVRSRLGAKSHRSNGRAPSSCAAELQDLCEQPVIFSVQAYRPC